MDIVFRINIDSDAFADGNTGAEMARILADLAGQFARADGVPSEPVIRDINGNTCGEMSID